MRIREGSIGHMKWSCKEAKGNKDKFKRLNVKSAYCEEFLQVLTQ